MGKPPELLRTPETVVPMSSSADAGNPAQHAHHEGQDAGEALLSHAYRGRDGHEPLHRDGLGLGVLEQAGDPVAAPQPRVLEAAHRRVDRPPGRLVALVDVDGCLLYTS